MIRLPPLGAAGALSVLLALLSAGRGASAQAPGSAGPPPVGTAPSEPEPSEQASDALDPGAPEAGGAEAEAAALAAVLAEVSSTGNAAEAAVADLEQMSLHVYGFADFTYTHRLNDFAYQAPYPTFMVGNINLYAGAELGGGWRSLIEFRLLYMPNGHVSAEEALLAEPQRVDTTVADPADFGRPQRWGGVEIERAWLEYSAHSLLTIRAGQWLTPYGIWNVDHGSPVIIGVRRPYVVGEALIPERQTGLELSGSYLVGRSEVGYVLGLSNGRGPLDSYQDLDKNKAVTGRAFVTSELPLGTLTVGGTFFRGRFTNRFSRFVVAPNGEFGVDYISTERYEELGVAGDVRWVWDALTLQGEIITRELAYAEGFRPALAAGLGPPGFAADYRSTGWYLLGAYRLPWWGVMPYIGGERYEAGQEGVFDAAALWGGLNIRPVPRVVLKAQYTQSWFTDGVELIGDDGTQTLDLQAAWSF